MVDASFWSGRRVFLTGHTGFKGTWLCLWLKQMGAQVTGFSDRVPTTPSLFELARAADGITDLRGDINDLDALSAALAKAAPEIVIHCAAQSLVRASYADPVETFRTNVLGTVHLLQGVRAVRSVKAVLIVTSDKCYENREWVWGYRESDPMGGYDPYSASKGAAEIVTASMRRSFFNPERFSEHGMAVASARAGNVIGGGDWSQDRLLPDLIRAFTTGAPALIRNPKSVRPWQFVLEPLSGYLRLCERLWADGPRYSDGWNFGPGADSHRSAGDIAQAAAGLWGKDAKLELASTSGDEPHEASVLWLDTAKARLRLGWTPRTDYEKGLRFTIDWYRALHKGEDAGALCRQQLIAWQQLPQQ